MQARGCASVGALVLSIFAGSALGADQGFYFGVLGGQAKYDFQAPRLVGGFVGASPGPVPTIPPPAIISVGTPIGGVTASQLLFEEHTDDKDTAWGVTAGYRAGRNIAVEANYLNLGTSQTSIGVLTISPVPPFPFEPATLRRKLETHGPAVSVLGILPLSDNWSVHARAGVMFADTEVTTSLDGFGGSSGSVTFGSESLLWGAGGQFDWGDHWSARLEFQRVAGVGDDNRGLKADIDLLSLGFLYRL